MADTNTASAEAPRGIELAPHQVILSPLVTEKGVFSASHSNQYTFEVSSLATKDDVKRAVEALFNVKVAKVRTQNRVGKPRRWRYREGYTKNWKKAIVTLDKEHRIDFF
jgi:large subunit ribosomal protein L23